MLFPPSPVYVGEEVVRGNLLVLLEHLQRIQR